MIPLLQANDRFFGKCNVMDGFIVGKGLYAAVPYGKELMIIHNGQQIKVCRTEASARKFIDDHKKGKSLGKLPIN